MARFVKESLETLKDRIDLVEVIAPHVDLKKAGASYKGLCPFHEEKTPSFQLKAGDTHYHCFGCGAHGDAIAFLMTHLKLSFAEAVESLAEKFNVPLQYTEAKEEKGPSPSRLKETLEIANSFFHTILLHTEEGLDALNYLFARGLSLDFIRRFELGWAPKEGTLFQKVLHEKKISKELIQQAGLMTSDGRRPFFRERITFPIRNPFGSVIGFSARKIREETFGGKYINTSETAIFKKSKILFGLNFSRRRIAKERKCIVVEGQLDCLRMIDAGFDQTIAALGTAFGASHVAELEKIGCGETILAFDGDDAGAGAASKVGDLFQKKGIEVKVASLPVGIDPDLFLKRFGAQKLKNCLEQNQEYLDFQFSFLSKQYDPKTPAGKNALISHLTTQIREWDHPVMVHESLKKLAAITEVPEQMINLPSSYPSPHLLRRSEALGLTTVDPNRILELDLLRWLILTGDENAEFVPFAEKYLTPKHFYIKSCRQLFEAVIQTHNDKKPLDPLTLLSDLDEEEGGKCLEEIYNKRINVERAQVNLVETIQKLLDRHWLQTREEIKMKIHSGNYSQEEVLALAKEFDMLKKPQVETL